MGLPAFPFPLVPEEGIGIDVDAVTCTLNRRQGSACGAGNLADVQQNAPGGVVSGLSRCLCTSPPVTSRHCCPRLQSGGSGLVLFTVHPDPNSFVCVSTKHDERLLSAERQAHWEGLPRVERGLPS